LRGAAVVNMAAFQKRSWRLPDPINADLCGGAPIGYLAACVGKK
jgi:hypothetical protein